MDTQTAAETDAKPAEAKPKNKPAILPSAIKGHDYQIDHRVVIVPGEYDFEDLLKPETWAHYAPRAKINSVLTCISDTGKFDVDLRVVEATGRAISVRPIRVMMYKPEEEKMYQLPEDQFEIRHLPNKGHGARNKFDGTWLFQGKATALEAREALKAHLEANRKN